MFRVWQHHGKFAAPFRAPKSLHARAALHNTSLLGTRYSSAFSSMSNSGVYNGSLDIPISKQTVSLIEERVKHKYIKGNGPVPALDKKKVWDAIIIGAGHNGLVTAFQQAKQGKKVLVLERRQELGGCAVSEEQYPGFIFSRASYLAGLLLPEVEEEMSLEKHGVKYHYRDCYSFTPTLDGRELLLYSDQARTLQGLSKEDGKRYVEYEAWLGMVRNLIKPVLHRIPGPEDSLGVRLVHAWGIGKEFLRSFLSTNIGKSQLSTLLVGPASKLLDYWFQDELLKSTLITDAVIGSNASIHSSGSAYVLLHHVMGQAGGREGCWAYVEGGMGRITQAMANACVEQGVHIASNATVDHIICKDDTAIGVRVNDTEIFAQTIVSNATAYHTAIELLRHNTSTEMTEYKQQVSVQNTSCGAMKINIAVDTLPQFLNKTGTEHLQGTVHFEDKYLYFDVAAGENLLGLPASRPIIEMTVPSVHDKTLAPPGKHVVQLFIQYVPYHINAETAWSVLSKPIESKQGYIAPPKYTQEGPAAWSNKHFKEAYAQRIYSIIDQYAPGFSQSILYADVLSPLDQEQIFGIQEGCIFHQAMTLDQIGMNRPTAQQKQYALPIKNMYICGASAHPGGGVMGAAGRNCAEQICIDEEKKK